MKEGDSCVGYIGVSLSPPPPIPPLPLPPGGLLSRIIALVTSRICASDISANSADTNILYYTNSG